MIRHGAEPSSERCARCDAEVFDPWEVRKPGLDPVVLCSLRCVTAYVEFEVVEVRRSA